MGKTTKAKPSAKGGTDSTSTSGVTKPNTTTNTTTTKANRTHGKKGITIFKNAYSRDRVRLNGKSLPQNVSRQDFLAKNSIPYAPLRTNLQSYVKHLVGKYIALNAAIVHVKKLRQQVKDRKELVEETSRFLKQQQQNTKKHGQDTKISVMFPAAARLVHAVDCLMKEILLISKSLLGKGNKKTLTVSTLWCAFEEMHRRHHVNGGVVGAKFADFLHPLKQVMKLLTDLEKSKTTTKKEVYDAKKETLLKKISELSAKQSDNIELFGVSDASKKVCQRNGIDKISASVRHVIDLVAKAFLVQVVFQCCEVLSQYNSGVAPASIVIEENLVNQVLSESGFKTVFF